MPQKADSPGFLAAMQYFREQNAEGLRILRELEKADKLGQDPASAATASESFQKLRILVQAEVVEAKKRRQAIESLADAQSERAWYARELVEVGNLWDDLERQWSGDGKDIPLAVLMKIATESKATLSRMVTTSARNSIPDELGNYLENYPIGKRLSFVKVFGEQFPDEASARTTLEWLADQSLVVSGLIDLSTASILKADSRNSRRILSVWIQVIMLALGFVLVALAVHLPGLFQLQGWKVGTDQWAVLNGGYVLVLLGVLTHWLFDRLKQNRAGNDALPLSEWLIWIHINETQIAMRILTVWIVLILGVAFEVLKFDRGGIQAMPYFLAGFFLDSTFDTLIGRFNTFVEAAKPSAKQA